MGKKNKQKRKKLNSQLHRELHNEGLQESLDLLTIPKKSFIQKCKDFFFPPDFMAQVMMGNKKGVEIRTNELNKHPILNVPYNFGKLLRKIIDPKHKMKFK